MTVMKLKYMLLFFLFLFATRAKANHLLGSEISYKYLGTNAAGKETYRVTLAFFADCSSNIGPSNAFSVLVGATPRVVVYNRDLMARAANLVYDMSVSDIEITPVCPDEEPFTSCKNVNNPLPGIKQYVYRGDFILDSLSENWRFCFEGEITTNPLTTIAGRSTIINNVSLVDPVLGPSIMYMEATLNNTTGPNSSTTFTSLPTPFFCAQRQSFYSLGAVDPENDSLYFKLISAKNIAVNTPPPSDITYIVPFTATHPLPAAQFNFSNANGQMSFVGNQVMNCLVTNLVEEYRNGVKVGTSMREMTFVILDSCTNDAANSPVSNIQNASSNFDVDGNMTLTVCEGQVETLAFDIEASDPNGDNTTITYQNLPGGATLDIVGNGGQQPLVKFRWNVIDVPPGNYTFYITYTDDGCPLVSTKTLAYLIKIVPHIREFGIMASASCEGLSTGKVWAFPVRDTSLLYNYRWVDVVPNDLRSHDAFVGDTLVNVPAGTYKVYIRNKEGCGVNLSIEVPSVPMPLLELPADTLLCHGFQVPLAPKALEPGVSYAWDNGKDTCCITVSETGTFRLRATNTCGTIERSTSVTFIECDFCLFVPNAFSPNEDGKNDIFKPVAMCPFTKYVFKIFNRWGQLVFSTVDTERGWDGTYNGKPADVGVYFYDIEAEPTDKTRRPPIHEKGEVTLMR